MTSPTDLQRQLGDFVRAFGLHQPDRTAGGEPVSTSEAHALGVISDSREIRLTDLAQELVLEKSTVSRLVGSMRARGWVQIVQDSADARVRMIRLTAAGKRAAGRLAHARAAHFSAVLLNIDPRKREAVVGALGELTRAAQKTRRDQTHDATA